MTITQVPAAPAASGGPLSRVRLHRVDNGAELVEFWRWMGERHDGPVCFDTESGGLSPYRNRHRMTQIGDKREGFSFSPAWMGAAHEALLTYCRNGGRAGAYNAGYDRRVLGWQSGCWLPWNAIDDAQLVTHLADSLAVNKLKPRAARDIDPSAMAGEKALAEAMSAQRWTWDTVPDDFPPYWQYGALDPVLTSHLLDKHLPEIRTRFSAAYDLELAYLQVVGKMMDAGMMIDRPYIEQAIADFTAYRAQTIGWLRAVHGIDSPDVASQVAAALEVVGVSNLMFTGTGKIQTNKAAMIKYAAHCAQAIDLIGAVQGAKKAGKVVSTYLEKMLAMAGPDGVIHCSIHTTGAQRSSRSSISAPSMQNFSRDVRQVRGGFVPRPGCVFVAHDADQIEMRLAAHFSGDPVLIADFAFCDANGQSFFLNFAKTIYGEITKRDPRYTTTKNTCYGMTYGSGPDTAAVTAGVTVDVIEPIYRAFKDRYAVLDRDSRRLINRQKNADHRPRVFTAWGRRLYLERGAEYAGIDLRIQGTAAEVLKNNAVLLDSLGYGDYLRLPIHDELLGEVPIEYAEDYRRDVARILTDREHWRVPLPWTGDIMTERWEKR